MHSTVLCVSYSNLLTLNITFCQIKHFKSAENTVNRFKEQLQGTVKCHFFFATVVIINKQCWHYERWLWAYSMCETAETRIQQIQPNIKPLKVSLKKTDFKALRLFFLNININLFFWFNCSFCYFLHVLMHDGLNMKSLFTNSFSCPYFIAKSGIKMATNLFFFFWKKDNVSPCLSRSHSVHRFWRMQLCPILSWELDNVSSLFIYGTSFSEPSPRKQKIAQLAGPFISYEIEILLNHWNIVPLPWHIIRTCNFFKKQFMLQVPDVNSQ